LPLPIGGGLLLWLDELCLDGHGVTTVVRAHAGIFSTPATFWDELPDEPPDPPLEADMLAPARGGGVPGGSTITPPWPEPPELPPEEPPAPPELEPPPGQLGTSRTRNPLPEGTVTLVAAELPELPPELDPPLLPELDPPDEPPELEPPPRAEHDRARIVRSWPAVGTTTARTDELELEPRVMVAHAAQITAPTRSTQIRGEAVRMFRPPSDSPPFSSPSCSPRSGCSRC
jgi:hypothetical protein